MIEIDGSFGEGGGQIVRTSLALSLATGKPVRLFNIRAGRSRPGLLHQHLTALGAAAQIGRADCQGAELGSRQLVFEPHGVRPGQYRFDVGSAGSATLVLQTVLPVLLTADAPSRLTLEGGTHNPLAPPFEFLEKAFLPLVERMGPKVTVRLDRPGFYPAGGGKMRVEVTPCKKLGSLSLLDRGPVRDCRARAVVSRLPLHIAERELKVVRRRLSLPTDKLELIEETRSRGPGNVVLIEVECENVTEVFAAFGQRGLPAERVAEEAAEQAAHYLEAGVPVGPHLADQLVLPMALGAGGSFVTTTPSRHLTTNIEVIRRFLEVRIDIRELGTGKFRLDVTSA